LPVTPASINVVEAITQAWNSNAGGGTVAPTVKSGATINEATVMPLSAGASIAIRRWETDPNTGAAWTGAAVNALEGGITAR
jgi:hypothetical protein